MRVYLDNCSFNRPFNDQSQIKLVGIKALTRALGEVNAEKFISLIMREPFDYTKWQRQLWEGRSVEDISGSAMELRKFAST